MPVQIGTCMKALIKTLKIMQLTAKVIKAKMFYGIQFAYYNFFKKQLLKKYYIQKYPRHIGDSF